MGCPKCHVANNWNRCPSCGGITCNSCGYSQNGKRKSANRCPYCDKVVQMQKCGAPSWAK